MIKEEKPKCKLVYSGSAKDPRDPLRPLSQDQPLEVPLIFNQRNYTTRPAYRVLVTPLETTLQALE